MKTFSSYSGSVVENLLRHGKEHKNEEELIQFLNLTIQSLEIKLRKGLRGIKSIFQLIMLFGILGALFGLTKLFKAATQAGQSLFMVVSGGLVETILPLKLAMIFGIVIIFIYILLENTIEKFRIETLEIGEVVIQKIKN